MVPALETAPTSKDTLETIERTTSPSCSVSRHSASTKAPSVHTPDRASNRKANNGEHHHLWYYCAAPKTTTWIPSLWDNSAAAVSIYISHLAFFIFCWVPSATAWILIAWPPLIILHIALSQFYHRWLDPRQPGKRVQLMISKAQASDPVCRPDSGAERKVLAALQRKRYEHTYQQRVRNQWSDKYSYRTDISVIRPLYGLKIDIEIDGDFKENDADIQSRIEKRNDWFLSEGWHVLRFHASQCHADPHGVADDIILYSEEMKRDHSDVLASLLGGHWEQIAKQRCEAIGDARRQQAHPRRPRHSGALRIDA